MDSTASGFNFSDRSWWKHVKYVVHHKAKVNLYIPGDVKRVTSASSLNPVGYFVRPGCACPLGSDDTWSTCHVSFQHVYLFVHVRVRVGAHVSFCVGECLRVCACLCLYKQAATAEREFLSPWLYFYLGLLVWPCA